VLVRNGQELIVVNLDIESPKPVIESSCPDPGHSLTRRYNCSYGSELSLLEGRDLLAPARNQRQRCSWSKGDFENCAVYRAFQPPVLPEHPFKEAHVFIQYRPESGPERSPDEAEHLGSEILQALQPGCFLQPIRPKVFIYEWLWRSDGDVKRKAIVTLLAQVRHQRG
jgi:hypothetical protein